MTRRVAYLVNQYPKVSHSFVRREILALERAGLAIERFALRGWDGDLVDREDLLERERTRYLLQGGVWPLAAAVLRQLMAAPAAFFSALGLALVLGRRADRPLAYHLVYLAEACLLAQWLRESGAEHVHAHFGTNSVEVAQLTHRLGGPGYSFTVHGPEEFDKPHSLKLTEKVRDSAFVVAISSFGRSQLYRWIPSAQWSKVKSVHCGLEPGFYASPGAPSCAHARLVCVGRLCEQKGQLLLVQALAQLRQRGVAVELVLAGDGEMRPEIEACITQQGLGEQVRITGWISSEQVREEILASRALVLPSFAEGLPVVLMEAMALRRPVITTFVAGIPELVLHGHNGWLVPAGDVDALADAMATCLGSDSTKLQAMGQAAHERVVQRHAIDTEAAKLAVHFEQACLKAQVR